ncbi:MAG: hypothetical protein [Microvirus sp.]|nr:MAG: hypothetical protein [Microvirus sp.]
MALSLVTSLARRVNTLTALAWQLESLIDPSQLPEYQRIKFHEYIKELRITGALHLTPEVPE